MDAVFNAAKMDRLIWVDQFLLHQFHELLKARPHEYNEALKTLFYTDVFGDSVMERKYNKV